MCYIVNMQHDSKLYFLLNKINQNQRRKCFLIIEDNKEKFYIAPGGLHKHQNWKGGYRDHIVETMMITDLLYTKLSSYRKLPFSLSECLYLIFLHDLEKMFRLSVSNSGKPIKVRHNIKGDNSFERTKKILSQSKIKLSQEHLHALKYCHGEEEDYHPTKRIMSPLAAFIHCCDTISARIWYQYPKHKHN